MILGNYLNIQFNGAVIAETTDVNFRMRAKALDTTSKDSGYHSSFIGGKVSVAMAGGFLVSSSGANWAILWMLSGTGLWWM